MTTPLQCLRNQSIAALGISLMPIFLGCHCVPLPRPPSSDAPALQPPSAPGAMAGNLSASTDGLLLTWLEPGAIEGSHRLRFSRMREHAWGEATTIAEGTQIAASWADTPSVREGSDGTLVAQWGELTDAASYAADVHLAESKDLGRTWTPRGIAHDDGTQTEHGFMSLLRDGQVVRAFWLDGRETAGHTHGNSGGGGAMTLRTRGVTSAVPDSEVLDARVCDCCGTSAAMTSEGPIVVFRDRSEDEIRDISIVRRVGGHWTSPVPVHVDGWKMPGCPLNGPAVAADGKRVAVAWFTYAGGRPSVRVAFSADAGATFSAAFEVDGPRGRMAPLGRVGVTLEKAGALVSWLASEREEGEVLVRRVTNDGQRGRAQRLTQSRSERESGFPRLASDAQNIFVVWTDTSVKPSRLRFGSWPRTSIPTEPEPAGDRAAVALFPIGAKLPDYVARNASGAEASLASLRGQVVLLNFWATWCEPCRAELPELQKLHEKYAAQDLKVVGVSLDSQQSVEGVNAFAARQKVSFPVWLDPEDVASRRLGVGTLPVTLLLGRDGVIVWSSTGAINAEDLSLASALKAALGRQQGL